MSSVRKSMMAGHKSTLLQLPTGAGKTVVASEMISTAKAKGLTCWFNVHRRELVKQSSTTLLKNKLDHGITAAGFPPCPGAKVQINSIMSLARRLKKMPKPDLIIWDECHHIASGSWLKIFKAYPNAFHVGLTATPQRLDGVGLGEWFSDMVEGPTVSWLIENKYLSDYKLFAPTRIDVSKLKTKMGDYTAKSVEESLETNKIVGSVVKEYNKACPGKRMIAFCASVKSSQEVAEAFNMAGVKAKHLDGKTPHAERDLAIREFRDGRIKVLTNVDLFGEGFDVPSIEAVALLRPTMSLSLYLQQVGRALRAVEGKTHAIILDHVGNYERHGLPDHERTWSLDSKKRKAKDIEDKILIKTCDKCFHVQAPGKPACENCGEFFTIKEREIEQVEGSLKEITKEEKLKIKVERKKEQSSARTLEDLRQLGRERGYSPRWADHVFASRGNR